MNNKKLKTFSAISELLKDLHSLFEKDLPLALYDRLIEKTTIRDTEAIERHIFIFEKFIEEYKEDIIESKDLNEDVEIVYKKEPLICVRIGKFMKNAPPAEKSAIKGHLLTICALISPDERVYESLEKRMESLNIDTSSPEGEFLNNVLTQAKDSIDTENIKSPTDAITAIFSSGILPNLMSGLETQMHSGKLDPKKLMNSMGGVINLMKNFESSSGNVEEVD